uniref:Nitrogen fixation protein FixH n=1 Tax=Candidatus Kentrum eta TaxID=2126337 RepID=A0A450VQQ7_9GAMM|nr:MAG: Nitrogen fixation protein FixH [Candidatus Kentron sp. H]VFK04282.1 MAG: Nitrogen fixation protein FixH [Candidatus Kentron sp. H]VFK07107.1 MAG: Nitrogen fixation protein FixH [Candidatus Kentron sp. H]
MNSSANSPTPRPVWHHPWVIGWIAIIAVILSVNATMIYFAIDSNPGLVMEDYYDRGQDYEKTVLTRQALGRALSLQVDVPPEIKLGEPVTFRFTGTDKAGQPIPIDAVTLHAYRPSDCVHDFSVLMTRVSATPEGRVADATEGGAVQYVSQVMFPLKGVWDIVIAVEQGGNEHNVPRRIAVAEH